MINFKVFSKVYILNPLAFLREILRSSVTVNCSTFFSLDKSVDPNMDEKCQRIGSDVDER